MQTTTKQQQKNRSSFSFDDQMSKFCRSNFVFSQTEYNEWEENLCKEKTKSSYQPWIFSQKKHLSVFTQQEKREKNIDHRQDIIILIS